MTEMDDVPFKISPKYQPPPRITLPLLNYQSISERSILLECNYDFSLEEKVIAEADSRLKVTSQKNINKNNEIGQVSHQANTNNVNTFPGYFSGADILTPIPANVKTDNVKNTDDSNSKVAKTLKPSDIDLFESESDPYDIVYRASIDEQGELKEVLTKDMLSRNLTIEPKSQSPIGNSEINNLQCQNLNFNHSNTSEPHCSTSSPNTFVDSLIENSNISSSHIFYPLNPAYVSNFNSVPTINTPPTYSEVNANSNSSAVNGYITVSNSRAYENSDSRNKVSTNPYPSLSFIEKQVVDEMVSMGFSQPISARVVKYLGPDSKKVVDLLCNITKLVDEKYDPLDVEKAMQLSDGNVQKAREYLDLLTIYRDSYGFEETKIFTAYKQAGDDVDKMLDYLAKA